MDFETLPDAVKAVSIVNIKQKRRLHQKEYYQKNREKRREHQKEYYQKNRERQRANNRERYQKNREIKLEWQRTYRQKNKVVISKQRKKYRQTPRGKILHVLSSQKRIARKKGITHNFGYTEWIDKILEQKGHCPNCQVKFIPKDPKKRMTMEHIIPICSELKKVYTINDVIPWCQTCNSSKKDRIEAMS